MAEVTTFIDDLDPKGNVPAERRYFTFAGKEYRIDLSDENNEKLEAIFSKLGDDLAPFLAAAKDIGSVSRSTTARPSSDLDLNEVRLWARENGYEVADRGRIKEEIKEAYRNRNKKK